MTAGRNWGFGLIFSQTARRNLRFNSICVNLTAWRLTAAGSPRGLTTGRLTAGRCVIRLW